MTRAFSHLVFVFIKNTPNSSYLRFSDTISKLVTGLSVTQGYLPTFLVLRGFANYTSLVQNELFFLAQAT